MGDTDDTYDFFQSAPSNKEDFEFFPIPDSGEGSDVPFALMANETTQILKTPFGVFKIAITANGPLAELAKVIAEIFRHGMSLQLLEQLTRLIAQLPEVREKLKMAPQVLELLESAKLVIAAGGPSMESPKSIRARRKASGMTFARALDAVHLN